MNIEQYLSTHDSLVYSNKGVSMLPMLRQGRDLMIVRRKREGERLKKYDVAFYKTGGTYILHRILKVKENGYTAAGDNNYFKENIAEKQILGVMTGLVRRGKKVDLGGFPYRAYVMTWGGRYGLRCAVTAPYRYLRRFAARIYHKIKGE